MATGRRHVRDYWRVLRLRLCLRPGDRDRRVVEVRRDGGPDVLNPRSRERMRNDDGSRGLPNGRRVLFQRGQCTDGVHASTLRTAGCGASCAAGCCSSAATEPTLVRARAAKATRDANCITGELLDGTRGMSVSQS